MMKTQQMANEITKVLEGMELKSGISYTTDTITVNLYKNDYDYSQVNLKLLENITAEEYVATVLHVIKEGNKSVREYKAPTVERFIIDLINKYDSVNFINVVDGEMFGDFENQSVPMDNIVEFTWTYGDILKLTECDAGDMYYHTLDFGNKTIETKVELLEFEIE